MSNKDRRRTYSSIEGLPNKYIAISNAGLLSSNNGLDWTVLDSCDAIRFRRMNDGYYTYMYYSSSRIKTKTLYIDGDFVYESANEDYTRNPSDIVNSSYSDKYVLGFQGAFATGYDLPDFTGYDWYDSGSLQNIDFTGINSENFTYSSSYNRRVVSSGNSSVIHYIYYKGYDTDKYYVASNEGDYFTQPYYDVIDYYLGESYSTPSSFVEYGMHVTSNVTFTSIESNGNVISNPSIVGIYGLSKYRTRSTGMLQELSSVPDVADRWSSSSNYYSVPTSSGWKLSTISGGNLWIYDYSPSNSMSSPSNGVAASGFLSIDNKFSQYSNTYRLLTTYDKNGYHGRYLNFTTGHVIKYNGNGDCVSVSTSLSSIPHLNSAYMSVKSTSKPYDMRTGLSTNDDTPEFIYTSYDFSYRDGDSSDYYFYGPKSNDRMTGSIPNTYVSLDGGKTWKDTGYVISDIHRTELWGEYYYYYYND